jgi:hypothetical protein
MLFMKKNYPAWMVACCRAAPDNGGFQELPCAGILTKDIFPGGRMSLP